jgi:putative Holliday junction resolvase
VTTSDDHGRIVALDHGRRRIGVAVSDEGRRLATPLTVIEERDPARALAAVLDLIAREAPTLVLVGLPLNMDGGEGSQAREAREFARAVERRCEVSVELWDERLTTFEAESLMAEAGLGRKQRKARRDAVAAQRLLDSYLTRP